MITVESLTLRYAGFTAVDDVSFHAEPGRNRVIGAQAIATLLVGLGSVAVAFAVGALGNARPASFRPGPARGLR